MPALQRAREMGLTVVLFDGSHVCPGHAFADHFALSDTYDAPGSANKAEKFCREVMPINGCMCVASDVPHTVAAVGERLGLTTISTATAKLAMDKVLMKDCFAEHGIPIPYYCEVGSAKDIKRALEKINGPAIIKPADSRGARGVRKFDCNDDLDALLQQALHHSPSNRCLVEAYISGPQFSTEALVVNGIVHNIGLSDRNYEQAKRFAPHIIEDGGDLPASLSSDQIDAVDKILAATAAALNLTEGVLKGDLVLDEHTGKMHVIEVATRLSGGFFCTHEIPLSTEFDFIEAAIKLALGETPSIPSPNQLAAHSVCQRYFFSQPGRLDSLPDIEVIAELPGVEFAVYYREQGDVVAETMSHVDRLGMVITRGNSREEARAQAENAVSYFTRHAIISGIT